MTIVIAHQGQGFAVVGADLYQKYRGKGELVDKVRRSENGPHHIVWSGELSPELMQALYQASLDDLLFDYTALESGAFTKGINFNIKHINDSSVYVVIDPENSQLYAICGGEGAQRLAPRTSLVLVDITTADGKRIFDLAGKRLRSGPSDPEEVADLIRDLILEASNNQSTIIQGVSVYIVKDGRVVLYHKST